MMIRRNERDRLERKKVTLLLISQYLLDSGYVDTLVSFEKETALDLSLFQATDNIDLDMIIKDFSEYHEFKYGKRPVYYSEGKPNTKTPLTKKLNSKAKEVMKKGSHVKKIMDLKSKNKEPNSLKTDKENKQQNVNSQKDKNNIDLQLNGFNPKDPPKEVVNDGKPLILRGLPKEIVNQPDIIPLAKNIQREIVLNSPDVYFKDVVGHSSVKIMLREAALLPLKLPCLFENTGLEPWKGALLFGPPGTGKTLLAKALANESNATFFNISTSSLVSKYHGLLIRGE